MFTPTTPTINQGATRVDGPTPPSGPLASSPLTTAAATTAAAVPVEAPARSRWDRERPLAPSLPLDPPHGSDADIHSNADGDRAVISHDATTADQAATVHDHTRSADGDPLTSEERRELDRLRDRDAEVRAHEQAHVAAAGSLFRSGPHYTYETGPDGKRYAIGGRVSIDTAPVEGDPQATIEKAARIRRAALAPADPSSTDRAVAAKANRLAAEAQRQLQDERRADADANTSVEGGPPDDARLTNQRSTRTNASLADLIPTPLARSLSETISATATLHRPSEALHTRPADDLLTRPTDDLYSRPSDDLLSPIRNRPLGALYA